MVFQTEQEKKEFLEQVNFYATSCEKAHPFRGGMIAGSSVRLEDFES